MRRGIIVIVAVVAAALPAAASAAPKIKYVTKSFTSGLGDLSYKTAKCKRGRSVIGGGFDAGTEFPRLGWLLSSGPVDGRDKGKKPDDGWRVGVRSYFGGDPITVKVTAVCARTKPRYVKTRTFNGQIPPGGSDGAQSFCVRGATLGGGLTVPENRFSRILGTYFTQADPFFDFGWEGFVVNEDDAPFNAFVWTICGPGGTITKAREDVTPPVSGPLREAKAKVSCPSGTKVSSPYGQSNPYFDSSPNTYLTELSVRRRGRAMRGAIGSSSNTGDQGIVGAVCVKRLPRR